MTTSSRVLLPTLLLALLLPSTATAGNCPALPTNWAAASCNDICTYSDGGDDWVCDLDACSYNSGLVMVSDFNGSGLYEAWGNCGSTLFCCETDGDHNPTDFIVTGSIFDDTLGFTWDSGTYNLAPTGGSSIQAWIRANSGADTLKGSYEGSSYAEYLYGEAGADTLLGNAGGDYLNGGADGDFLNGGIGNDELRGDSGDDEIIGGSGNDWLYGDQGEDMLSGGAGADHLDGGSEGDTLCGDEDGDWLDDGDNFSEPFTKDVLWGSTSADTDTCQSTSTSWDGAATESGDCGTVISTRPEACP